MRKLLLLIAVFCLTTQLFAAKIKGKITDQKGEALAFASVYIKGTTKGTTTNLEGLYAYELEMGTYTFVCQYVGYEKQENVITIDKENITKNFTLISRGKELRQVVIKKGEDPAMRIIRKTIKKRSEYNKEIDKYKANAYIKGSVKLKEVSSSNVLLSLMGMSGKDSASKAERQEMEASKGILFLSESYNEIAYKRPDKLKVNVKRSRVSGNKNSYGFSDPLFVNMYDNNVNFSEQISPRGFISPIAETALFNYKYELIDTYHEDGKTISIIKVIPRRKFEPLFSGILHVIENEWRLHSVDLMVDKNHQLENIDTLRIKQIFVPVNNVLMVKDQSFAMDLSIMGFGFSGNFVNVFTDYVFDYDTKSTFDKFEKVYDKDALTHTKEYWDAMRPVPLDTAEAADYVKKDSIEIAEKAKKDTMKIVYPKNNLKRIVTQGFYFPLRKKTVISTTPLFSVASLLNQFNWNTVEGLSYGYGISYFKRAEKDLRWRSDLYVRYGFSNKQLNAKLTTRYAFGKTNKSKIRLSGGRYIFQYNNSEPVNPLINSFYTLFYGRNYLKFYQAWFGDLRYAYNHVNGFTFIARVSYQDRNPLSNTNLYSFINANDTRFTQNYPVEKVNNVTRHQALVSSIGLSYQPGRKYIKYPDRIVSRASHYPTFEAQYIKGIPLLGSDVDYDRWKISMDDDMRFNLWGTFMYRASVGGFLRKKAVSIVDYTHFNGNQIILASPYLNSFQLSSYYGNSNTESLYATLNAEHHFYGLLTNKIPLFRRLKYYLVAATNMYYVNQDNNYIEVSAGLENIGFKFVRFLRVDAVVGYNNLKNPVYGIRLGINSNLISFGGYNEDD